MKVLIDACVLYPTVTREIVIGVAQTGAFAPLWSARILEEWARATAKLGPEQQAVARGEIALLRAQWSDAEIPADAALEQSLYLPDINDRHVLGAAISGGAEIVMTSNLRDFPRSVLAEFSLVARHPDEFLRDMYNANPDDVGAVVARVHRTAQNLSGQDLGLRRLLKKARLPRLAKAMGAV